MPAVLTSRSTSTSGTSGFETGQDRWGKKLTSSLKATAAHLVTLLVAAASDRKLGSGLVKVAVSMERSYIMSCLHGMCWVSYNLGPFFAVSSSV